MEALDQGWALKNGQFLCCRQKRQKCFAKLAWRTCQDGGFHDVTQVGTAQAADDWDVHMRQV